jgi:hypothetical protein
MDKPTPARGARERGRVPGGAPRVAAHTLRAVKAVVAVAAVALLVASSATPARASVRRDGDRGDAAALHGRAMWIWKLADTDGGDRSSIIADAHARRLTTLIIKSSDGTRPWSQFTPALVAQLHHAGLHVCAWQYVYGDHPGVEANLGADAVRDGADCLVIDAEVQYQGKYVAAQTYIHDLREQINVRYPLALAGLADVADHPFFPYSVFLGAGGAQCEVPQMYWRAMGVSVDSVFARTYALNLPYDRPIDPLGQIFGNPPTRQIVRFRQLARLYHADGVSWWSWQSAAAADWRALSAPIGRLPGAVVDPTLMASVGEGARGDLVVWLQEHLVSAGDPIQISGEFGPRTVHAVENFQAAHRLLVDGIVGTETWRSLLEHRPVTVRWMHRGRRTVAAGRLGAPGG